MEKKDEDTNSQVVFSWKAPLRPYKKTSGRVLRFYIALALIFSSLIFFFGDNMLLLPIWAALFLFYILTITPPPEVKNKITIFGIETAGVTARWEMLSHFYLKKRFGFEMVVIVSHAPYFYHMYLVLPTPKIRDKVVSLLSQKLIYQERPRKEMIEKLIDSFTKIIPSENQEEKISAPSKAQVSTL